MKSFARVAEAVIPMLAPEVFADPHRFAVMGIAFKYFLRTLAGFTYADNGYSYDCNCD